MTEDKSPEEGAKEYSQSETKPARRDQNQSEAPPPMNSPARGPMDQAAPDVATGSTPVTRRDD